MTDSHTACQSEVKGDPNRCAGRKCQAGMLHCTSQP